MLNFKFKNTIYFIFQVDSPLRLPASKGAAVNNGKYTCTATNFIQPTGRQRLVCFCIVFIDGKYICTATNFIQPTSRQSLVRLF